MVFFESPHRLGATLRDAAGALGKDRPACVVRELTKMFEEVAWGSLAELAERFAEGTKGEIVLVMGGEQFLRDPGVLGNNHIGCSQCFLESGACIPDVADRCGSEDQHGFIVSAVLEVLRCPSPVVHTSRVHTDMPWECWPLSDPP